MDFGSFNPADVAEKGARLVLINPATGEPFDGGTWIDLRGFESESVKAASRDGQRAMMRATTPEQKAKVAEKTGLDVLVSATIAWSDDVKWDGKPFPCTPENARKLYSERSFVARQVMEFMANEANFMPSASVN